MATPIRSPVNVPGPDPDGDPLDLRPSRLRRAPAPRRSAAAAGRRGAGRCAGGGSSRASTARSLDASHERDRGRRGGGVEGQDPHRDLGSICTALRSPPRVLEPHRAAIRRERRRSMPPLPAATRRRRSCPAEVVGQQLGVLVVEVTHAGTGRGARPATRPAIALADREGRAGDRRAHAERPAGAAHEGGLARAQLALDQHHVARRAACARAPRRAPRSRRGCSVRSMRVICWASGM